MEKDNFVAMETPFWLLWKHIGWLLWKLILVAIETYFLVAMETLFGCNRITSFYSYGNTLFGCYV